MTNFNNVQTAEQIHSEELNEILIKTPPRLFKTAIIIFTGLLTIGLLGFFLIDYQKTKQFDYILYQPEHGAGTVVFFSKEDISAQLRQSGISLHPNTGAATPAKAFPLRADSIVMDRIYTINNKRYTNLTQEDVDNMSDIDKTAVQYKYYLYLPYEDGDLKPGLADYKIGKIFIPTGKVRLYQLLFSRS